MIERTWDEKREYYNTDNALIKSQSGFKEFRIFGIRISRRNVEFNSSISEKKGIMGFNTK